MAAPRHNPTELAPRLEIFDQNEVLQHTFETEKASLEVKDPQLSSLIAHLKFNDDVVDSAGDNHGVVTGTETFVDGKKGRAFSFVSTRITLDNEANFDRDRLQPFSVSCWINSTSTGIRNIWDKGLAGANPFTRLRILDGATFDKLEVIIKNNSGNLILVNIDNIDIRDGNYHHISITYSGSSTAAGVKFYLDGISKTLTVGADSLSSSTLNNEPMVIGAQDTGGGNPWLGEIDDWRFHNVELTQADVDVLFGVTQDIKISDLILEQGVGSNWGKLVFIINDHDNTLTKNTLRRESTIERQWRVKLQCGKTSAGLDTWFEGKILESEILRPTTGMQQLMVTCVGWGDVLRNRFTKLIRNQEKLADGIDVDTTDNSTRIDELLFDIIHGVDHQIEENILPLSVTGIPGLVSYLNFHNELLDVASRHHGTQTGGVETYTNGLYGKKYGNRAGEGEEVILQDEGAFDFMAKDNPWSIMIRITSTATTIVDLIDKRISDTGFRLRVLTNNDIEFQIDGGDDEKVWTYPAGVDVTDGNSHTIIVTWDGGGTGGKIIMYIDGKIVRTTVAGAITAEITNNEPIEIGDLITGDDPLLDLEEFRIYNIKLSSEQVEVLHNAPLKTESATDFVCPDCLSIQVPNINMTYSSYASAISRLIGLANVMWMINPDRHLVARDPFAHDSGFLFTNNLGGTDEQNWPSNKLGYILEEPISWIDSSTNSLYNFVHGVGPFAPLLDNSFVVAPDNSDTLATAWHAIPFKMKNDNVFKVSIRSIKLGIPEGPAEVLITGGDLTDGPNTDDTRRTIKLSTSTLNQLGTTTPADWFEIPVKPKLEITPDEQLFIVFKRFGTTTDTMTVNYKAGDGTNNFWDSPTGAPLDWTVRPSNSSAYRAYSGRRLEITVESTEATAKINTPREKLIPLRADLEELTARQALIAAAALLGKSVRTYSSILVSIPDNRPELLKFCIIEDEKTGLKIKADMIGLRIEMHAKGPSQLGTDRMTLVMEDSF